MNSSRQFMRGKIIIALALSLYGIPTTLATPLSSVTELNIAQNLTPQEVNLRAKQFTVRIDGAGIGTGVIIDQSETTYTVLTNWHVVQQVGEYSVQTIDGRKYSVNYSTVKQLPNLDLAVLQFERQQNYQLAEIGDSNNVIEGQNIYFAGYPGELRQEDNRYYRFFTANLVGILPESTENGYSLIYNGEAFPGMSGGPVLDSQGLLIGIHGEANINAITGGTSNYAIPIARYQASIAQVSASSPNNPNNQSNTTVSSNPPPTTSNTANSNSSTSANPSVVVETTKPQPSSATATPPEKPQNQPTATVNSTNSTVNNPPASSNTGQQDLSEIVSVPTLTPSSSSSSNSVRTSSPSVSSSVAPSSNPNLSQERSLNNQPPLLSRTTGIDYTPLKELLAKQKWQQADKETQQLIVRIIDTAKRQNKHSFITISAIADYSCRDIRTIDRLWQQYTSNKFGFTPQQAIWLNLQQNSNFSPDSWRRFATEIGWKQGDIASSGGYLLYEQLKFDPQNAPQGHLPWWFATSEEQQNIIKSVFNRCSFQETEEVEEVNQPKKETNQENKPVSPTLSP